MNTFHFDTKPNSIPFSIPPPPLPPPKKKRGGAHDTCTCTHVRTHAYKHTRSLTHTKTENNSPIEPCLDISFQNMVPKENSKTFFLLLPLSVRSGHNSQNEQQPLQETGCSPAQEVGFRFGSPTFGSLSSVADQFWRATWRPVAHAQCECGPRD